MAPIRALTKPRKGVPDPIPPRFLADRITSPPTFRYRGVTPPKHVPLPDDQLTPAA